MQFFLMVEYCKCSKYTGLTLKKKESNSFQSALDSWVLLGVKFDVLSPLAFASETDLCWRIVTKGSPPRPGFPDPDRQLHNSTTGKSPPVCRLIST